MLLPQTGLAAPAAGADPAAARTGKLSPIDQNAQSTVMAKEARDKAEALQRDRDRRMKEISKGICSGC